MKGAKVITNVLIVLTVILMVLPSSNYYLDLLQSFTFHAFLGLLFFSIIFFLLKWKSSVLLSAAGIIVFAFHLLPHISNGLHNGPAYGAPFTVAHFNVLASNTLYESSIRQALNTNADVISFQEVDMEWLNELVDRLADEYPYYVFANGSVHGVAVFARHPIEQTQTHYWTGEPTLTGDLLIHGNKVHFVTTHTLSPRSEARFRNRNQHLLHIAEYVKNLDGPVLAIGDFNAVPWSHHIVQVKQKTDLQDSRKSITATYPSNLKLGIPIDYIMHSDELSCLRFDTIEASGSDHKGVLGEYALASPEMLVNID